MISEQLLEAAKGARRSGWKKISDHWNKKVYEHQSGLVRVVRNRKDRTHTRWVSTYERDRRKITSTWSQVDLHVKALGKLGLLDEIGDAIAGWGSGEIWLRVESPRILHDAKLAEAQDIAEAIIKGRKKLEVHKYEVRGKTHFRLQLIR